MELLVHLRSPRLLVVALLFGLVVLSAAYGISQSIQRPDLGGLQIYAHPSLVNESGNATLRAVVLVADRYGEPGVGELVIMNEYTYGVGPEPVVREIDRRTSNASGLVEFSLGVPFPPPSNKSYEVRTTSQWSQLLIPPDLLNRTFTVSAGSAGFSGPFGSSYVLYLHVIDVNGTPATSADVFLDDVPTGRPDSRGFLRVDLPTGSHSIRIAYRGDEQVIPATNLAPTGPVYNSGADAVVAGMAFSFIPFLLPILAISVSFDAVAREKAHRSLDLLLCKPITRTGILIGKFCGGFAAVAVPAVSVLSGGIAVVALASGIQPSASLVVGFLLSALFLIAVYVLLMLILSSTAKSTGTALVFGIGLWLFFNLLFAFLAFFLLVVMGQSPSSRGLYETLAFVLLMNPNVLYQMLVATATPGANLGPISLVPAGYVSGLVLTVAASTWIIALFLLALFVFWRRAPA